MTAPWLAAKDITQVARKNIFKPLFACCKRYYYTIVEEKNLESQEVSGSGC